MSNKLYDANDLNKENDNYNCLIDHWCKELGFFQTKGRLYYPVRRWWYFSDLEGDWYKEFNKLVAYCASEDGKVIERIYEFPKEEIIKRTGIAIYKNPSRGIQWYEQYRVKDEERLKEANDLWKKILEEEN